MEFNLWQEMMLNASKILSGNKSIFMITKRKCPKVPAAYYFQASGNYLDITEAS